MHAADVILAKVLVASNIPSSEWERVRAEFRNRAFFSARVESVRVLAAARTAIAAAVAETRTSRGTITSREDAIRSIRRAAQREGLATGEGGLTDLGSRRRAEVIVDTNAGLAAGYVRRLEVLTPGARVAFPCQELVRSPASHPREPRDWPTIWESHGGRLYGGERMIARVEDPIWSAISRFDCPFPPFDYNSGMIVRMVPRHTAVDLGVIPANYSPPPLPSPPFFNAGLSADMTPGVPQEEWARLKAEFGDQVRQIGGRLVWRHELFREAFTSGGNFTIRLGVATDEMLSMLPRSVPAQSCAGKPLTIDQTWLDRKRKDVSDHRAHRTVTPLTDADVELLPAIWRRPDKVEMVGESRLMLSMDSLDGKSTYKAVIDGKGSGFFLVMFYRDGK